MATDPPVLTVLDRDACLSLLRSAEVGRLAFSVAGQFDIFPINYALDNDTIVFCTAEGTKLAETFVSSSIAFECDGYDADSGDAWSVVVKGRAHEVEMHDLLEASAFPLHPWSATPKSRFVRLLPDEITGRRFHVVRR
jgi:uncharacterized protein